MRSALNVGVAMLVACGGDSGGDGEGEGEVTFFEPDALTETETESEGDEVVGPTDLCDDAPSVPTGRTLGTLRGASPVLGGACGNGGPEVFVVIDVPRRSDVELTAFGMNFQPRIGVLREGCVGDWVDRALLCAPEGPGWVLDVAEGTALTVAVGIDPDDPAREIIPTEGNEPLAFALDVRLRSVLEPGENCGGGLGRCVSGSACLPGPDGDAPRCFELDGDTCQSADEQPISLGTQSLQIDRATLQTNAHEHSCAGARRPERVVRLRFDDDIDGQALRLRADDRDVALALRAPGCGLAEEIACAPDDDAGAQVSVADLGAALGGGDSAFLFVELPASGGDGDPSVTIEVELTDP